MPESVTSVDVGGTYQTDSVIIGSLPPSASFHGLHIDAQVLPGHFDRIHRQATDQGQFLSGLASVIASATGAQLILWSAPTQNEDTKASLKILAGHTREVPADTLSMCVDVAKNARQTRQPQSCPLAVHGSATVVAVPGGQENPDCLLAVFQGVYPPINLTMMVMQLAIAHWTTWQINRLALETEAKSHRLAAMMEMVSRVESAATFEEAALALANEAEKYFACDHVVVGFSSNESTACKVVARSNVDAPDADSEQTRLAQAVLDEAIARGEPAVWPANQDKLRHALLAHRRYAEFVGAKCLLSSPLRDELGRTTGAWLLAGESRELSRPSTMHFIRAAETPIGSALRLQHRARRGRLVRAWHELRQFLRGRPGRATVLATILGGLVLLVPMPYQVKCQSTVEPVVRRYVAAPFAGPLEKAFVEPGDVVEKGQLLAQMDGREIRWELAGARAELHRATKERAGHLATHDSGKAEVARHEVDQLQLRTELLEHRDQNLEIRSPIDGIIVSGDLREVEGMPLTVGQSLFEVAPLDQMVVELSIPEDDIPFVHDGMPVTIQFDAFPRKQFKAIIGTIHPRAELKDSANVFVAEVQLTNTLQSLRPGMRGHAWIQTPQRPLGWIWLRRPITAALAWLGW